jgi:hypothetical protein
MRALSPLSSKKMTGFRHFTVATRAHPNLALLRALGKHFGLGTEIVGWGDKLFTQWGQGFIRKIQLYHEAVRATYLAEGGDTVILLTDSYDFLPLADADEIVRRFEEFDADIVYNAEVYCHPWNQEGPERDEKYRTLFPEFWDTKKFRYLNSGGIIGRAKALLALFDIVPYEGYTDDQKYHHDAFLLATENADVRAKIGRIALDRDTKLFFCGAGAMESLVHDSTTGTFTCSATGNSPVLLHFNGSVDHVRPTFDTWNQKISITRNGDQPRPD